MLDTPVQTISSDSLPESDWEALNAFNHNHPEDWFSDVPLVGWKGVTIDDVGQAIGLRIFSNELKVLLAEIGYPTQLQHLELRNKL